MVFDSGFPEIQQDYTQAIRCMEQYRPYQKHFNNAEGWDFVKKNEVFVITWTKPYQIGIGNVQKKEAQNPNTCEAMEYPEPHTKLTTIHL
jgi:hypothetical protein